MKRCVMEIMLRNIVIILLSGLIVFLNGCISTMSPEALKSENSYDLCKYYASSKSENVKLELIWRGAIPDNEWPLIEKKLIQLGMSELGLVCSWGIPNQINKTVVRWGTRKQWIYCPYGYYNSHDCQYVYTDNGKITAWQN